MQVVRSDARERALSQRRLSRGVGVSPTPERFDDSRLTRAGRRSNVRATFVFWSVSVFVPTDERLLKS